MVVDGVLFHVEKDRTLQVVPPVSQRKKLFDDAHSGLFGGHLREAKMHSQLSRHFWWPKMRADIEDWCRGCLTCATHKPGHLPVEGPFDRISVDVIQYPKSERGNRYAMVFVDYLTKWPEVFPTVDQTTLTIAKLLVQEMIPRHGHATV